MPGVSSVPARVRSGSELPWDQTAAPGPPRTGAYSNRGYERKVEATGGIEPPNRGFAVPARPFASVRRCRLHTRMAIRPALATGPVRPCCYRLLLPAPRE
jgi:hypothetical protein